MILEITHEPQTSWVFFVPQSHCTEYFDHLADLII